MKSSSSNAAFSGPMEDYVVGSGATSDITWGCWSLCFESFRFFAQDMKIVRDSFKNLILVGKKPNSLFIPVTVVPWILWISMLSSWLPTKTSS